MIDFESYVTELFKKQRESRIHYKDLMNARKDHGEKCMFCDCSDDSIKSHSISENVLAMFSDNNDVIFPKIDPCNLGNNYQDLENTSKPNIKFERTKIASAGTFRGFCQVHDNDVFQPLDDFGITTQKDIFLQLYRTACKYYFTNLNVEKTEKSFFGYYYNSNPEYEKKIDLSLSELKNFLEDMLIDFPELASPIPNTNQSVILEPMSENFSSKCLILYRRIQKDFNFAIENDLIIKMNDRVSHCLFVLLPGKNFSSILAISSPEIIKEIHNHLNSKIQTLNLIESIMMQDSQFYLPPKIVENWPLERKETIINDFFFITERYFLQEYDISIFDELRINIISNMENSIKTHELRKIKELPSRKEFAERFLIYRNTTIKDRQDKLRFTGNKDGNNYPIGALVIK